MGEFDEQTLILLADDGDLADAMDRQQAFANVLQHVPQLRQRKPVAGEGVNDPEDIAEFIVVERALHTGRQGRGNVADLLADLIPQARHIRRRRVVPQRDHQHRVAGLHAGFDVIQ